MTKNTEHRIEFLIERLGRLAQAKAWAHDLNPAQFVALEYLANANRFSRSPSHVADYLGATRGTVSQTLKALSRKGLVAQIQSETDKRSVHYEVTEAGAELLKTHNNLLPGIVHLDKKEQAHIATLLNKVLHISIRNSGGKTFGICKSCRHHDRQGERPYCRLLSLYLMDQEADLICHEHVPATDILKA